jgi:hypothetical protein
MKISAAILSAILIVQASCAATVPRNDDYSQLEALLKQAGETAKAELAAAEADETKRTLGAQCTLKNLSIRREWSVASASESPEQSLMVFVGAHCRRRIGRHIQLLATAWLPSLLGRRLPSRLAPNRDGMYVTWPIPIEEATRLTPDRTSPQRTSHRHLSSISQETSCLGTGGTHGRWNKPSAMNADTRAQCHTGVSHLSSIEPMSIPY